jgi:hypothetical protein
MAYYADPMLLQLDLSRQALRRVESSGNYGAMGPVTKSGDRAYGAYQVMGANIPSWTQAALGQSMTPEQFLASKEAQDAVFNQRFGGYLQQYGNPQDAASMWFSGRPLAKAGDASDGYNTVPEYVTKFNAAMGQPGLLGTGDSVPGQPSQPSQLAQTTSTQNLNPNTGKPVTPEDQAFAQLGSWGQGIMQKAAPAKTVAAAPANTVVRPNYRPIGLLGARANG